MPNHSGEIISGIIVLFAVLVRVQKLFQCFEFRLFQVFCSIGIDIHSGTEISMTKDILNDLDVYLGFAHSCCKGMPQGMTAEFRKKSDFISAGIFVYITVAVTNNTPQSFVKGRLVMHISETVDKDQISIAVNFGLAVYNILNSLPNLLFLRFSRE